MAETSVTDQSDKEDPASALAENRFHSYEGSAIPWYVRLIWLGFWILAVAYVVLYLLPILPIEIENPP